MITAKINDKELRRKWGFRFGSPFNEAMADSMNKGHIRAREGAIRYVAARGGVSIRAAKRGIYFQKKARRTDLETKIKWSEARRNPLHKNQPLPKQTKEGVVAKYYGGKMTLFKGAFKIKKTKHNVWRRVGKARLPIKKVAGTLFRFTPQQKERLLRLYHSVFNREIQKHLKK